MGASVGLQTRKFVAIDVDIDDKKLSREIDKLAYATVGQAARRIHAGSQRCLLLYRLKDGEALLRKRRLAFTIGGAKAAVEMLALGQQCVVEGKHPKGGEYAWPDWHPCNGKPEDLTEITPAKADAFFVALADTLELYGYPITAEQTSSSGGGAGKRRPIGSPELMARCPEDVLALLKACPNNEDSHGDFVTVLAAIKGSLGDAAEDFYPIIEEWALGYGGNTGEYVRAR